jgi:hypothetical protein
MNEKKSLRHSIRSNSGTTWATPASPHWSCRALSSPRECLEKLLANRVLTSSSQSAPGSWPDAIAALIEGPIRTRRVFTLTGGMWVNNIPRGATYADKCIHPGVA